jgi:hypothetical protein
MASAVYSPRSFLTFAKREATPISLLMAMLSGSTAELFDRACFNFPTLGEFYKAATDDALRQRAAKGSPE